MRRLLDTSAFLWYLSADPKLPANVSGGEIEIAQQNSGVHGKPRVTIDLKLEGGGETVDHPRILGWLRMR